MFNPNYIYSIIFVIVVALYQLGWSNLYPKLSPALLGFLLVTILINLVFGFFVNRFNSIRFSVIEEKENNNKYWFVILLLLFLWGIDKFFGDIPTIHILLITFTSFYSVHIYSRFLKEQSKTLLFGFVILFLSVSLFGTYRILIFFNLITYLLTFIYIRNPLKSLKGKIVVLGSVISILYIFGYLGNNLKGDSYNDGELILIIGEASDEFRESFVPNEFFWTFLYASSPLANLELNIENKNSNELSLKNAFLWFNSEFMPDFISRKVFEIMNEKPLSQLQINDTLNVSTVYIRSYRYASWFGLFVMAMYIAIFPVVYLSLIKNTKFFIPGLVSLITVYLFLVFDNLFAFSAISFQLVYPLLSRIIIFRKKINGV